jgi:hypothetical protein
VTRRWFVQNDVVPFRAYLTHGGLADLGMRDLTDMSEFVRGFSRQANNRNREVATALPSVMMFNCVVAQRVNGRDAAPNDNGIVAEVGNFV